MLRLAMTETLAIQSHVHPSMTFRKKVCGEI